MNGNRPLSNEGIPIARLALTFFVGPVPGLAQEVHGVDTALLFLADAGRVDYIVEVPVTEDP